MPRRLSPTRAAWAVQPLYVVAEVLTGLALGVSYSYRDDTISALGTTCAPGGEGCAVAGWVMNTVFVLFGALQALGAWTLLRSSAGNGRRLVGALWATAGVFSILVGLFPVDAHPTAHTLVALPVFLCQPLALLLHARLERHSPLRSMGTALAVVSIVGALSFGLLLAAPSWAGLAERAAIWPAKLWLALCLWQSRSQSP
jgi:hypothetical membrane protein